MRNLKDRPVPNNSSEIAAGTKMSKTSKVIVQDYGTSCSDCERYRKLGDICMIEHGKKFQWEYCRDFVPEVVLPDYKELMRSVRADRALERKKENERKDKEKRKRLKEKSEKEELRKKKRRSMLRKRRERVKQKLLKEKQRAERKAKIETSTQEIAKQPTEAPRKADALNLENPKNSIVGKRNRVTRKRSDVSDNQR